MKKRIITKAALCAALFSLFITATAQIPARPAAAFAVNDYASIFTYEQRMRLEVALEQFADTTSNRIVIVTTTNLGGMDVAQYAYNIGEKWGVGKEGFNNGVVIAIKPKIGNDYGEVYIAVGYGLEGVITDAFARRISDNVMIPYFREGDYFGGICAALNTIMPIISGEISMSDYEEGVNSGEIILLIFFLVFLTLVIIAIIKDRKNGGNNGSNGGDFDDGEVIKDIFIGKSLFGGSGWGNTGSFGGGHLGGGFSGGFGGGHFGGGGGGGRW